MARSSSPKDPPAGPPALRVPLNEARGRILAQMAKGEMLLEANPRSWKEFFDFNESRRFWDDYNKEILRQFFTSSEIADEYLIHVISFSSSENISLDQGINAYKNNVIESLTQLKSIVWRLDLFSSPLSPSQESSSLSSGNDIFLVHGHNNEAKETVARFLEGLGLKVTILHEQPDRGLTIIEKFEHYAPPVGYAVVLLMGDDVGADLAKPDDRNARARQNVVLELGYFLGKLGRNRVCSLLEEGVEIPSDLGGVLYVPFNKAGAWKLRLAQEIKAAGIELDLDRII